MGDKMLIRTHTVSNNTLANLDRRDIALWVSDLPTDKDSLTTLVSFLSLPWRLVLLETQDRHLITALDAASVVEDSLARKRGFIQIIDSNPRNIKLPSRCLPIYLLDGRPGNTSISTYEKVLQRMNMLDDFRQSGVRELIVVSAKDRALPADLDNLWASDFRSLLTVVSDQDSAKAELESWLTKTPDLKSIQLIETSLQTLTADVLERYWRIYPTDRFIVRMRDSKGEFHQVDLTNAEEIERPISDFYGLILERHLAFVGANELSKEEFVQFFTNPIDSWRPFAAGVPWFKNSRIKSDLRSLMQKLDVDGPDENRIAYIASEPGAGGTTLSHALAFEFARDGYPVLVAHPQPFVLDPLPIANFLTRAYQFFIQQTTQDTNTEGTTADKDATLSRLYETPWIIVFDTVHWQNRDSELMQFRNALSKSGRPVCLLVVTDTVMRLPLLDSPVFKKIAELNHTLSLNDAQTLGQHLNSFLEPFNLQKTEAQWRKFYESHAVQDVDGIASFWITLSFWIQGYYDFEVSIQDRIYTTFKQQVTDPLIHDAILQIAAMSSERLPLPQSLLPKMPGRWPVWQLLEDNASNLASLGLIRVNSRGEPHWALIHDILGRLLVNALFNDFSMRDSLGFAEAKDVEHLRFLILRKISQNPRLGETSYVHLGESFAQQIFKIDPSQGKNNFAKLWQNLLGALDKMSPLLRNTNRVFLHHTAVSRRRIAKLDTTLYDVTETDKLALLERAIHDIEYALKEIPETSGSESNLNLLNSLALAYFDLIEIKVAGGAAITEITKLKQLAKDTTLKAYRGDPNNSFTIETYVRSLIQTAKDTPDLAHASCVEALGVVFSALHAGAENSRAPYLEHQADQAIEILLQQTPLDQAGRDPRGPVDLLVRAWMILAQGRELHQSWSLDKVSIELQKSALKALEHPAAQGNLQILHLKYDLTCNCYPHAFGQQLELLEPLRFSESWLSPQLQLEYAILLFQRGRAVEGDRRFRELRRLWQTSEQFVRVPDRLRWLRALDEDKLQVVKCTIAAGYETRGFALVREFQNIRVPFRPEEHGFKDPRPGQSFNCTVSFGYNGPFLRPLSVFVS